MLRSRWKLFSLAILCISLLIPSLLVAQNLPEEDQRNTYELRKEKALEILSYLNTSADTCKDFYNFACGNYGEHFQEQIAKKQVWSPVHNIGQSMEQNIIKHLYNTDPHDSDVDRNVKHFYTSCVNKPVNHNAYNDKLRAFILEFGQMPVLEGANWLEHDFDWSDVVAKINAKTGVGIIWQAKMRPDPYNNSITRASLVQPQFMLPKKIYYVDSKFAHYQVHMKQLIQKNLQTYLNVDEKLAKQTAAEIFAIENALAQGMQDMNVVAPNILFSWKAIEQLQFHYFHAWDTIKHIATALDIYPTMVMAQMTYLNNLADVIQRTSKRKLANYVFYMYIWEYIQQIEESCITITRKNFNEYLENSMYHKHVTEAAKEHVSFMMQELKYAFEDSLHTAHWMSDYTRSAALQKLHAMQLKFSSYEHIDFKHKYAGLSLSEYDFLENLHAILVLHGKEIRATVYQPPKFDDAPTDGLGYSFDENIIYIPVAIVQTNTLWSITYPNAINFGSLGIGMAHEMGHAFDDLGRHYDKDGNYHDWWDYVSSWHFEERKGCITNQYKNYKFKGNYLPHLESQFENIADNVGATLAYKAYMKWYYTAPPQSRDSELLPLLQYNNEQLFFVSLAQTMGGAHSASFVYDNDPHVPGEVRVKGMIDNMIEFSRAFNCPLAMGMGPMSMCKIY